MIIHAVEFFDTILIKSYKISFNQQVFCIMGDLIILLHSFFDFVQ